MTDGDAVYIIAVVAMTGMVVFLPYILAPALARRLFVFNIKRYE